jgi:hypothetical protein
LIFSHRSPRQQAADLARIATKAPVEVWIKDVSEHDIENIDTPLSSKPLPKKSRKYRVVRKEKADELENVETEKLERKAKAKGRRLPTKAEILEKATQMVMEDQVKQGLEPVTPEETELNESGVFEEARRNLMTGEDTFANSQFLQYVDALKQELEPMGFTVISLAESEF